MVDIAIIGSALKSATDVLKSIKDLMVGTSVQAKIAQAYEEILSAREAAQALQEERTALLKHISTLEEELIQLKAWGRKKEQYELKNVDIGALAYVPKPGTDAAKEPHWLCAQCAEENKPGYLQSQKGDVRLTHWTCAHCAKFIRVNYNKSPLNPTGEQQTSE